MKVRMTLVSIALSENQFLWEVQVTRELLSESQFLRASSRRKDELFAQLKIFLAWHGPICQDAKQRYNEQAH